MLACSPFQFPLYGKASNFYLLSAVRAVYCRRLYLSRRTTNVKCDNLFDGHLLTRKQNQVLSKRNRFGFDKVPDCAAFYIAAESFTG